MTQSQVFNQEPSETSWLATASGLPCTYSPAPIHNAVEASCCWCRSLPTGSRVVHVWFIFPENKAAGINSVERTSWVSLPGDAGLAGSSSHHIRHQNPFVHTNAIDVTVITLKANSIAVGRVGLCAGAGQPK